MNMEMAMESKVMVGLAMEMAGVMEKSKMTAGSEAETVVGTETGVDTDVGMGSKSMVDTSGNVGVAAGAEAGVGSVMVSTGANAGAEMGLMAVGTCAGVDAEAVAEV